MKRGYNLKAVLLLELISMLVGVPIAYMFVSRLSSSDYLQAVGFFTRYLLLIVVSAIILAFIGMVLEFVISKSLLHTRNGSVSDYFSNIRYLRGHFFLALIVLALVEGIVNIPVAILTQGLDVADAIDGGFSAGMIAIVVIGQILSFIIKLLFAYNSLVVVDNLHLTMGELIGENFKVGKDLLGKTFITHLKYYILPYIGLVILLVILMMTGMQTFDYTTMDSIGSLIGSFAILIVLVGIWTIFANSFVAGELSSHYLNYKDRNKNNIDGIIVD